MVEKLKRIVEEKTILLVWVIIGLTSILTLATTVLIVDRINMPDKFVRLERYQADQSRMESAYCRLESKLESFAHRMDRNFETLISIRLQEQKEVQK